MGCVWNGKGLSHGLKTVHRTVFTAAALPPPFRVPPFLLEVAVRQKGLVTLRSIRRKRRVATVHRTVALGWVRVRPPLDTKKENPRSGFSFLVRVFLWDFSKNAVIPRLNSDK